MTGKVCPIAIKMWVLNIQVISVLFFNKALLMKLRQILILQIRIMRRNHYEWIMLLYRFRRTAILIQSVS